MVQKKSFEKSLEELEKIVNELEGGEVSLEDSVKKYEAGVKLLRECYQYLERVEGRIRKLVKRDDGTFGLEGAERPEGDE